VAFQEGVQEPLIGRLSAVQQRSSPLHQQLKVDLVVGTLRTCGLAYGQVARQMTDERLPEVGSRGLGVGDCHQRSVPFSRTGAAGRFLERRFMNMSK
jgi:hypothetical protein